MSHTIRDKQKLKARREEDLDVILKVLDSYIK